MKRRGNKTNAIRSVLALLVLVGITQAGTIFFEDFEAGVNQDVIAAGSVIQGTKFQVIAGNVDHVKDDANPANPYSVMCGSGGSCLDLTGSTVWSGGVRGAIETVETISFAAPGEYYLRFTLLGWKDHWGLSAWANIQVKLGEFVNDTVLRNGATNPYDAVSYIFMVTQPTSVRLSFHDVGGQYGFAGAILDNVEVGTLAQVVTEEVPEPATILLIIPVFAGMAILRKRARTAAA